MNPKEQLQPPSDVFIKPLLELRDYYAGLTQEYQRLFIEARSQLDHAEALLSNWSYENDHDQFSQLENANQEGSLLFLSSDNNSDLDFLESIESELSNLDQLEIDYPTSPTTEKEDSRLPNLPSENDDHFIKRAEVPMLPQYHPLTRMEALKKLLHEYAGTVCHIDFIVRSLYGELEPTIFRVVKGRVQSSLTQGRERGYWSAIPNEPGCYTLVLSLLAPNHHHAFAQSVKTRKKKSFILPKSEVVPMLRAFAGQFLIDAITSFLQQNPGQIFSVNEIVNGIYGDIDSQQLREVKNKVLNELSRGHRTGRFSRVPNQIGFYTWDANTILQKTSR